MLQTQTASRIKTLHLTNCFHSTSGGIKTFYNKMLESAENMGRRMILIVPGTENGLASAAEFTKIYTVRAPRSPLADGRYRIILPSNYLLPWAGAVNRILREEQPDLIEICDKYTLNWMGGLFRKGFTRGIRRPVLVGLTMERMDDNVSTFIHSGSSARRFCRFYLRYHYIPMFDHHIAISHYTAEELNTAMIGKHRRPVWIRPLGVDTIPSAGIPRANGFREKLVRELGLAGSPRLLLYAGRVSHEKNMPLLLDMMKELARSACGNYCLVIAGEGPLMPMMQKESEHGTPGRVKFLGHVNDKSYLVSLYTHCDAFVHPNPREPFGIAPLEAMGYGLPLVLPNAGGVLTYAAPDNSWIAEPDGKSFAAAVLSIFGNPELRQDKIGRARRVAENYRWPGITRDIFDLYDRLHNQQITAPRFFTESSLFNH
ncbi:MAG: glycosyltransferase [Acidobacteria bacterium]|nr:glycosyltransferase [Acidobacteriota bacterium]